MGDKMKGKSIIKVLKQIVRNREKTILMHEKTISDLRKMLRKMENVNLEVKEGI